MGFWVIRLTENDLHKIVKESVNKIINEIGDTEKGQDALGQVRGRADKRSKLLGGAMGNKYRKISHDAQEKAYSQGEKHGFDIYDPNGAYDKGISKGYEKALAKEPRLHKIVKESVNRILKESVDGIDGHNEMWQSLYDAFNYAHNIGKGAEMFIEAFNNNIFPLFEKMDKTIGYRTPEYFKGIDPDDLITDWGDHNYDI